MKKNLRRIAGTLLILLGLVSVVSACSGGSTSTDGKGTSHVGSWKADGFEADVTASEITISIVGNDTKSLYWTGTFSDTNGTVKSAGDTDAMNESMLGSQDTEKTFSVEDDKISFEMSMMGTTKTIHLKRA